jgi:hypothetical protein
MQDVLKFTVVPCYNSIWNQPELTEFLVNAQGKHIEIHTNQEGYCCTSIGLYQLLDLFEFASVKIITANPLEKHNQYTIDHKLAFWCLKVTQSIDFAYQQWNKKYIFGAAYHRPSWHRLGLASYLLTQHPTISTVGLIADPTEEYLRKDFDLAALFAYDPAGLDNFAQIANQLPKHHALTKKWVTTAFDQTGRPDRYVLELGEVYPDFLIDVVGETFVNGTCFFPTEKTVRPMQLKKPMIVMGTRNFLYYLRQMGFRTFHNFWDEDYDGFDGKDRYNKILKVIDSISAKSADELDQMYKDMQPILEHNYNLLYQRAYTTNIKEPA